MDWNMKKLKLSNPPSGGKKGFALIYALMIVTLVSITIASMASFFVIDTWQTQKALGVAQAYQLAHSGLEQGIILFREGKDYSERKDEIEVDATNPNIPLPAPKSGVLTSDTISLLYEIRTKSTINCTTSGAIPIYCADGYGVATIGPTLSNIKFTAIFSKKGTEPEDSNPVVDIIQKGLTQ